MKIQISLDSYQFNKGYLYVNFNIKEGRFIEDYIYESVFEKFIRDKGLLEYYEDRWDGFKESHYTESKYIEYSYWLKNECTHENITEFLEQYYKKNKIPEPIKE